MSEPTHSHYDPTCRECVNLMRSAARSAPSLDEPVFLAPLPAFAPAPSLDESRALTAAARAFVTTLYQSRDCQHDFEGHNLPAIERYLVRRWRRAERQP